MSRLSKEYSDLIKRGQFWQCKKCGKSIKSRGHIHHKDGDSTNNTITNLVALCVECHNQIPRKRDRYWLDEWLRI